MKARRHNAKGRSGSEPRFVQIPYWVLETPAARALSGTAFKVLVYVLKRFNGVNNGAIGFGNRSGCFSRKPGTAELENLPIGLGKSVMQRALVELETAGFIRCMKDSTFDQKRKTKEWRLTWLETGQGSNLKAPTKDFVLIEARVTKQNAGPPKGLSPQLQARQRGNDGPQVPPNGQYRPAKGPIANPHRPAQRTHLVTIPSASDEAPEPGSLQELIARAKGHVCPAAAVIWPVMETIQ